MSCACSSLTRHLSRKQAGPCCAQLAHRGLPSRRQPSRLRSPQAAPSSAPQAIRPPLPSSALGGGRPYRPCFRPTAPPQRVSPSCTACTSASPEALALFACAAARRGDSARGRAARATRAAPGRPGGKRASAASCTSPTSCDLNAWWRLKEAGRCADGHGWVGRRVRRMEATLLTRCRQPAGTHGLHGGLQVCVARLLPGSCSSPSSTALRSASSAAEACARRLPRGAGSPAPPQSPRALSARCCCRAGDGCVGVGVGVAAPARSPARSQAFSSSSSETRRSDACSCSCTCCSGPTRVRRRKRPGATLVQHQPPGQRTAEAQAVMAEPQADGAGLEEDLPQVECPLISGLAVRAPFGQWAEGVKHGRASERQGRASLFESVRVTPTTSALELATLLRIHPGIGRAGRRGVRGPNAAGGRGAGRRAGGARRWARPVWRVPWRAPPGARPPRSAELGELVHEEPG